MTGMEAAVTATGIVAGVGIVSTVALAFAYARERTRATDARLLMQGYKTGLENSQADMKEKDAEIKKLNAALSVVRAERDEAKRASVANDTDAGLRDRINRVSAGRVPRAAGSESTEPTGGLPQEPPAAKSAKRKR